MKLRQTTLILYLVLVFTPSLGSEVFDLNNPEMRAQLENMIKYSFREFRNSRENKDRAPEQEGLEFYLGELRTSPCVNCRKILELSKSITTILEHMSEQLPIEHQQKIHELMAVDVYTQKLNELNEQDCHRSRIFDLTDEFLQYDIDQAIVLHSQEIDLNHLVSFRLQRKSQQQTIFLRGQGEDSDQLIRVDFQPDKSPLLTIYQLNPKNNPPVKHALSKDKSYTSLPALSGEIQAPPSSLRRFSQSELESINDNQKLDQSFKYFDYKTDKYGLPRKLTILEFHHIAEISDQVRITNDLEVSTSDQSLVTQITDQQGRQYIRFLLDKEGEAKAVIPFTFQALDTHFVGELEYDKDGATGLVNMTHSSKSKTRLGHTTSIGMTTLEHTRQINSNSQLTLRMSDGQHGQQSMTLNYRMVLN